MGFKQAERSFHLPYGVVVLPDGRPNLLKRAMGLPRQYFLFCRENEFSKRQRYLLLGSEAIACGVGSASIFVFTFFRSACFSPPAKSTETFWTSTKVSGRKKNWTLHCSRCCLSLCCSCCFLSLLCSCCCSNLCRQAVTNVPLLQSLPPGRHRCAAAQIFAARLSQLCRCSNLCC